MQTWIIALVTSIIASIIGGIILYFVFGIGKPKQVTAPSFSSITPSEIRAELAKTPPFQIKQAYSSYRGIKIKWDIEFSGIHSIYGISGFYHSGTTSDLIRFRICLRRYPEIKTMKRGDKFTVTGTISSIDELSINLRKCHLIFSEKKIEKKPELKEPSKQIASVQDNTTPALPASQPAPIQLETKSKIHITPEEIEQSLSDLPPFQRPQAAKNFEGLEIEWLVELLSITTIDNQPFVATSIPKSASPLIVFYSSLERYPELKIMKKGELFTVNGKIASVGLIDITLNDCSLHFNK